MLWIAHRGNLHGPNPAEENHPVYLKDAMDQGYHVEVDVWMIKNYEDLYLGHEAPQYETNLEFLRQDRVWCHCKNLTALSFLTKLDWIHAFWHQEDNYTLTSEGFIWVYPGNPVPNNGIMVLPERSEETLPVFCAGICTDYVEYYRSLRQYRGME